MTIANQIRKTEEHWIKLVHGREELVITGRYLELRLGSFVSNVSMVNRDGELRHFCLLEVLYLNRSDQVVPLLRNNVKIIDTEGYQREQLANQSYQFRLKDANPVREEFQSPVSELEGGAKARGWLWFQELPAGVLPQRIIFRFNIFEPGVTSGVVRDYDVLEFQLQAALALSAPQS